MMRTLRGGLKSIDIFGAPVTFNINGNDTYTSSFGGSLTILMVIVVLVISGVQQSLVILKGQFVSFVNRSQLTVETLQSFDASPMPIELNNENFMFAVAVEQDGEYSQADRPYFMIEVNQNIYLKSPGSIPKKVHVTIPLEPCSLERFKKIKKRINNVEGLFQKYDFQKYLCPLETFNFELEGAYLSDVFKFISIKVIPCVHDIAVSEIGNYQQQNCAPQEEIVTYAESHQKFRINLYTSNYQINPHGLGDDYFREFISEDLSFFFQPGGSKDINVFFNTYDVTTDNNLFISSNGQTDKFIQQEQNSFREQEYRELLQEGDSIKELIANERNSMITFNLRSSSFSYSATRTSMKIADLLSYFGGIFQTFAAIFGFFLTEYNSKFLMLSIANKLYHFPTWQQSENVGRTQSKVIIFINQNTQTKVQPTQFQEKQNNQNGSQKDKQIPSYKKKQTISTYMQSVLHPKKLKQNFKFIINLAFCGRFFQNPNNKLMCLAIEKVKTHDMDIQKLLIEAGKVHQIKTLILTQDQKILFNDFSKEEFKVRPEEMNGETETTSNLFNSICPKLYFLQSFNILKRDGEAMKLQERKMKLKKRIDSIFHAYQKLKQNKSSDISTQAITEKLFKILGSDLIDALDNKIKDDALGPIKNQENEEKQENPDNHEHQEIHQNQAFSKGNQMTIKSPDRESKHSPGNPGSGDKLLHRNQLEQDSLLPENREQSQDLQHQQDFLKQTESNDILKNPKPPKYLKPIN